MLAQWTLGKKWEGLKQNPSITSGNMVQFQVNDPCHCLGIAQTLLASLVDQKGRGHNPRNLWEKNKALLYGLCNVKLWLIYSLYKSVDKRLWLTCMLINQPWRKLSMMTQQSVRRKYWSSRLSNKQKSAQKLQSQGFNIPLITAIASLNTWCKIDCNIACFLPT